MAGSSWCIRITVSNDSAKIGGALIGMLHPVLILHHGILFRITAADVLMAAGVQIVGGCCVALCREVR